MPMLLMLARWLFFILYDMYFVILFSRNICFHKNVIIVNLDVVIILFLKKKCQTPRHSTTFVLRVSLNWLRLLLWKPSVRISLKSLLTHWTPSLSVCVIRIIKAHRYEQLWCVCRSDWEDPELHIWRRIWNLSSSDGKRLTNNYACALVAIVSLCWCKLVKWKYEFLANMPIYLSYTHVVNTRIVLTFCDTTWPHNWPQRHCCRQWPLTVHSFCLIRCDAHSGPKAKNKSIRVLWLWTHASAL